MHPYRCIIIISLSYNIVKHFCSQISTKGDVTMNSTIERKVGQNIRRLRENAGLTQELLSAKLQLEGCDIIRSAVAKIEVGQRHLYPDEIILLKKILKVDYEDIFRLK